MRWSATPELLLRSAVVTRFRAPSLVELFQRQAVSSTEQFFDLAPVGLMVRDAQQIKEVRQKLTKKYKLKLHPGFRCDFRDPWGNRIQVGDLSDESLVWLLPYQEVQKAGITFDSKLQKEKRS